MRKIFVSLLFLLVISEVSVAQKLSQAQIQQYLGDLQKEKILTAFGKDALQKILNKETSNILGSSPFAQNQQLAALPDSILQSRTGILGFLGIVEVLRNVGLAADDLIQLKENTEKLLGERMAFRPDVEANINPQNPLTFLETAVNIRTNKENYLVLANRLKAIGLLHPKAYEDVLKWLEKDRIFMVKDFGFFVYAARQNWFYENYENLKAKQINFMDSLRIVKLLPDEKYKLLVNSYKPYELKSKIEMLSNCQNIFLIDWNETKNTREEIYQKLYSQIKTQLLPDFDFTELKVFESKKAKNQAIPLEMNPLNGLFYPMQKNKTPYILSLKVKNAAGNSWEYQQKADTDFQFAATLKTGLPPDVHIDSSVIQTYSQVFSFLTGITNKDIQAVNDFLADKNSAKKVFVLSNDYNPFLAKPDTRKAVMLLDSSQYEVVARRDALSLLTKQMNLSPKIFTNKNSRENLKKIIGEYVKYRIAEPISDEDLERIIVEFRQEGNYQNIPRSLLKSIPNVTARVNFNPFNQTDEQKAIFFKEFIAKLSRISRGNFTPEKVSDNFDKEIPKGKNKDRNLAFSFRWKGKKYEDVLVIPKAEMPPPPPDGKREKQEAFQREYENADNLIFPEARFIGLVNDALQTQKATGIFYNLGGFDGSKIYIYLTNLQHDSLNRWHPEVFNDFLLAPKQQQISLGKDFNAEKFVESLHRDKAISEENYQKIISEPSWKNTKEPSVILKNSENAIMFDLNELKGKTNEQVYEYVLKQIKSKMLPKMVFSDLKIKKDSIFVGFEEDTIRYIVSLKINGLAYETYLNKDLAKNIEANLDSLKKPKAMFVPQLSEFDFKFVNDFLTDSHEAKRMIVVDDYRSPKAAFMFLDSTQSKAINKDLPNNYVDYSMYRKANSRDSLQALVTDYQRVSLLPKLSDGEIDTAIVRFRREKNPLVLSFLEQFPDVIVEANQGNGKDIFKATMNNLSKISRGNFQPEKVQDNFAQMLKKSIYKERTFKFGFMLTGKVYEDQLLQQALPKPKTTKSKKSTKRNDDDEEDLDYSATDFLPLPQQYLTLANAALNEKGVDGLFYECFERRGDTAKYIFLNNKQHQYLKNKYPEIFQKHNADRTPKMDDIEEEK